MKILLMPFVVASVLPVLPFVVVYFCHYWWKKDRKRSLILAMDITTLFLILSVAALFNQIFNSGFGIYLLLLLMIISGGLIGGAQNRIKGAVDPKRLIRAVWRLSFLFTSVTYLIFCLIGLMPYIWNT